MSSAQRGGWRSGAFARIQQFTTSERESDADSLKLSDATGDAPSAERGERGVRMNVSLFGQRKSTCTMLPGLFLIYVPRSRRSVSSLERIGRDQNRATSAAADTRSAERGERGASESLLPSTALLSLKDWHRGLA